MPAVGARVGARGLVPNRSYGIYKVDEIKKANVRKANGPKTNVHNKTKKPTTTLVPKASSTAKVWTLEESSTLRKIIGLPGVYDEADKKVDWHCVDPLLQCFDVRRSLKAAQDHWRRLKKKDLQQHEKYDGCTESPVMGTSIEEQEENQQGLLEEVDDGQKEATEEDRQELLEDMQDVKDEALVLLEYEQYYNKEAFYETSIEGQQEDQQGLLEEGDDGQKEDLNVLVDKVFQALV